MKTPWIDPRATAFLEFLRRYQKDRGALANLRGALTEARRPNAWPLLGGFPGAIGNPAYETVAGLWAADPEGNCATGNLGNTLAALVGEHNSFEGRFKRLLACDPDELPARVAPVVRAAQAKGVRVNYAQILSDLLHWDDDRRTAWAKAFWGAPEDEAVEETV